MARCTFKAGDEWALRLSTLGAKSDEIAQKALYDAAGIVADQMRANLEAIPTDKFRYLQDGDTLNSVSKGQKEDLLNNLCVTPILQDAKGDWNVCVGFDGYGSYPTKQYPKGIPNVMLARSVESGTSVREKHPFSRPAVSASKKRALAAMQKVIDEECKKIMKG